MRVGLNLMFWAPRSGGAARYARELIPSLLQAEPRLHLTAFVSRELPSEVRDLDWAPEVEWVTLPAAVTYGPAWAPPVRLGLQWAAIPALAVRRRLELVHGLANIVPPVAPRIATVATLLDLIWLRFDGSMARRDTLAMKTTALVSAHRATRVIAISEAGKRDIVETLDLPPERIDVTPLGVRLDETVAPFKQAELRSAHGLGDGPVLLCVAQKRAHKNLAGLVRALALLPDERAVLVLPGSPTPHEEQLRALAAELGVAERVHFPAWVGEGELDGLYALATAFVLPSFEEGFGLPILEAMARDVPVACSNVSALPEVAGDAAELFNPHAPEDIARAVGRLLSDPEHRTELVARGRERCRQFTWERTALATLASYRSALG